MSQTNNNRSPMATNHKKSLPFNKDLMELHRKIKEVEEKNSNILNQIHKVHNFKKKKAYYDTYQEEPREYSNRGSAVKQDLYQPQPISHRHQNDPLWESGSAILPVLQTGEPMLSNEGSSNESDQISVKSRSNFSEIVPRKSHKENQPQPEGRKIRRNHQQRYLDLENNKRGSRSQLSDYHPSEEHQDELLGMDDFNNNENEDYDEEEVRFELPKKKHMKHGQPSSGSKMLTQYRSQKYSSMSMVDPSSPTYIHKVQQPMEGSPKYSLNVPFSSSITIPVAPHQAPRSPKRKPYHHEIQNNQESYQQSYNKSDNQNSRIQRPHLSPNSKISKIPVSPVSNYSQSHHNIRLSSNQEQLTPTNYNSSGSGSNESLFSYQRQIQELENVISEDKEAIQFLEDQLNLKQQKVESLKKYKAMYKKLSISTFEIFEKAMQEYVENFLQGRLHYIQKALKKYDKRITSFVFHIKDFKEQIQFEKTLKNNKSKSPLKGSGLNSSSSGSLARMQKSEVFFDTENDFSKTMGHSMSFISPRNKDRTSRVQNRRDSQHDRKSSVSKSVQKKSEIMKKQFQSIATKYENMLKVKTEQLQAAIEEKKSLQKKIFQLESEVKVLSSESNKNQTSSQTQGNTELLLKAQIEFKVEEMQKEINDMSYAIQQKDLDMCSNNVKCERFESQIQELTKQNQTFEKELERLKKQNQKLSRETQDHSLNLKMETEELRHLLSKQKKSVQEKRKEAESLKIENNALNGQILELNLENENIQRKIQKLETQLDLKEQKIDELNIILSGDTPSQLNTSSRANSQLESSSVSTVYGYKAPKDYEENEKIKDLEEQIQNLQRQVYLLKQENIKKQKENLKAIQGIKEHQNELRQDFEQKQQKYLANIESAKAENQKLLWEVEKLEEQIGDLKQRGEGDSSEKDRASIKNAQENLEQCLSATFRPLPSQIASHQDLRKKLSETKEENLELCRKLTSINRQKVYDSEQISKLEQQIRQFQKDKLQLTRKCHKLQNVNKEMMVCLEELQLQKSQIMAQIDKQSKKDLKNNSDVNDGSSPFKWSQFDENEGEGDCEQIDLEANIEEIDFKDVKEIDDLWQSSHKEIQLLEESQKIASQTSIPIPTMKLQERISGESMLEHISERKENKISQKSKSSFEENLEEQLKEVKEKLTLAEEIIKSKEQLQEKLISQYTKKVDCLQVKNKELAQAVEKLTTQNENLRKEKQMQQELRQATESPSSRQGQKKSKKEGYDKFLQFEEDQENALSKNQSSMDEKRKITYLQKQIEELQEANKMIEEYLEESLNKVRQKQQEKTGLMEELRQKTDQVQELKDLLELKAVGDPLYQSKSYSIHLQDRSSLQKSDKPHLKSINSLKYSGMSHHLNVTNRKDLTQDDINFQFFDDHGPFQGFSAQDRSHRSSLEKSQHRNKEMYNLQQSLNHSEINSEAMSVMFQKKENFIQKVKQSKDKRKQEGQLLSQMFKYIKKLKSSILEKNKRIKLLEKRIEGLKQDLWSCSKNPGSSFSKGNPSLVMNTGSSGFQKITESHESREDKQEQKLKHIEQIAQSRLLGDSENYECHSEQLNVRKPSKKHNHFRKLEFDTELVGEENKILTRQVSVLQQELERMEEQQNGLMAVKDVYKDEIKLLMAKMQDMQTANQQEIEKLEAKLEKSESLHNREALKQLFKKVVVCFLFISDPNNRKQAREDKKRQAEEYIKVVSSLMDYSRFEKDEMCRRIV